MKRTDCLMLAAVLLALLLLIGHLLYAHADAQERLENARVVVEHLETENAALKRQIDAIELNLDKLQRERREIVGTMQGEYHAGRRRK